MKVEGFCVTVIVEGIVGETTAGEPARKRYVTLFDQPFDREAVERGIKRGVGIKAAEAVADFLHFNGDVA